MGTIIYDIHGNKYEKAHHVNAVECVSSGQYFFDNPTISVPRPLVAPVTPQPEELTKARVAIMKKMQLLETAKTRFDTDLDKELAEAELRTAVLQLMDGTFIQRPKLRRKKLKE